MVMTGLRPISSSSINIDTEYDSLQFQIKPGRILLGCTLTWQGWWPCKFRQSAPDAGGLTPHPEDDCFRFSLLPQIFGDDETSFPHLKTEPQQHTFLSIRVVAKMKTRCNALVKGRNGPTTTAAAAGSQQYPWQHPTGGIQTVMHRPSTFPYIYTWMGRTTPDR